MREKRAETTRRTEEPRAEKRESRQFERVSW
jgi:hypothetical protein